MSDASKIVWGDPVPSGGARQSTEVRGYIGSVHVATVHPDRSRKGGYFWVTAHLGPLPNNLDTLTLTSKASERQAKATAQRVVNAFVKILTGEKNG